MMMLRRVVPFGLVLVVAAAPLRAQTIEDGVLLPKNSLCTGFTYGHDRWTDYWEGTLKRSNRNVGTVTTESLTLMAAYGITQDLNVIAMLPYVKTSASGGTLHGQKGVQDLTLAAKYRLFTIADASRGRALRSIAVASYGVPVTNYVPDLFPLTIGMASQRFSGRLTLNFQMKGGFYANASAAYSLRKNVTLDRPAYFTNGELHLTDKVAMPDAFDYTVSAGYMKGRFHVPLSFSQQNTLGGGDIRRQDMPFVSNKMNFQKLDALVMYTLPKPARLAVKAQVVQTLAGRNVGRSTTVLGGLMYTIQF